MKTSLNTLTSTRWRVQFFVQSFIVLFLIALTFQVQTPAFAQEAESNICGGGQHSESLNICDQGLNLAWKDTPNYSCNAVSEAKVVAQTATQTFESSNTCYDIGWDQNGWHASEKWSTEEERLALGCEKIIEAKVEWKCDCNAPTPSVAPTPDVTPRPSMAPSPRPTPECVVPSPSPTPSVTPSPSLETPAPTPTPEAGVGGTTEDADEENIEEVYEEEYYPEELAETGVVSDVMLMASQLAVLGGTFAWYRRRQ